MAAQPGLACHNLDSGNVMCGKVTGFVVVRVQISTSKEMGDFAVLTLPESALCRNNVSRHGTLVLR